MTLPQIDGLQANLETMLTAQWNGMPDPKPTYTEWFYGDGGPRDVINILLDKMRDQVIKKTFVPGCIKSKNRFFRPTSVGEDCKKKGDCIPYAETLERLNKVAA